MLFLGLALLWGTMLGRWLEGQRLGAQSVSAKAMLEKVRTEADSIKNKALIEAEGEIRLSKQNHENELSERRVELRDQEKRLIQREELLQERLLQVDRLREQTLVRERELEALKKLAEEAQAARDLKLQEISRLSAEEARDIVLKKVEQDNQGEIARRIRLAEEKARDEAERRARKIIVTAIQKWSAEQSVQSTISVVHLPSDEMKGRIIGREGRNIRILESLTGVDLIVDDTPEAVVLSCFDPVRREIARIALEALIADGRIHPTRIEEMVEAARKEMDGRLVTEGEKAALAAGVSGLHAELIKLMGRLYYRTSFGQNVLSHSVEVSFLCAQIAAELGAHVEIARRAGFLHDIGKAVTGEMEGPHAIVGARLCLKYGETDEVCHGVEAHHEDVEQTTVEAVLVQSCDAISAARPGARREDLDTYVKRLERLERVANDFPGVEHSFAIQAGREIRIMVRPDEVDDAASALLARDVARRIEQDLDYPGQIKITVVRETRAHDLAR